MDLPGVVSGQVFCSFTGAVPVIYYINKSSGGVL